MIKLIVAIKRRPGMSPEDFHAYWRTKHAASVLSAECTRRYIRRYIQAHTLLADYAVGEPAFDGTAELWFDTVADIKAFYSDPEYLAKIAPDEMEFADMANTVFIQTEEETVI